MISYARYSTGTRNSQFEYVTTAYTSKLVTSCRKRDVKFRRADPHTLFMILCISIQCISKIVIADLIIEILNTLHTVQTKSLADYDVQKTTLARLSKTTDDHDTLFQTSKIQLVVPIKTGYIRRSRRLSTIEDNVSTNLRQMRHTFHRYQSFYRNSVNPDGTDGNETIWIGGIQSGRKISRQHIRQRLPYFYDQEIGFCTFHEVDGTILSGTISTENAAYDLVYHLNGTYEIRTAFWDDFPEDDPNPKTILYKHKRNYRYLLQEKEQEFKTQQEIVSLDNDTPWKKDSDFDSLYVKTKADDLLNDFNHSFNERKTTDSVLASTLAIQQGTAALGYPGMVTVDVLVVVTNRAICEYSGIKTDRNCYITTNLMSQFTSKVILLQSETNNALKPVNVRIRVVQILFLNNAWDPVADGDSLQELQNLDEIQQYRNESGADLVTVIAGQGGYCGITNAMTYRSIVNVACLAQYSFSHEIGHCLGAKHNRESMENTNHPYAYAYRDPNGRYRTIDAYDCSIKSCQRVPFYSSLTMTLPDGSPLGNDANDNLRAIYDNALTVSKYRATSIPSANNVIPQSTLKLRVDEDW